MTNTILTKSFTMAQQLGGGGGDHLKLIFPCKVHRYNVKNWKYSGGHIPSVHPGGGAHVPDPHRHCNNEQLGQIGEDSGVHHIHEPHKPEI